MESTTLRMEKKALDTLSRLARQKYLDRGTYMRQLLMKQLEEEQLREALDAYQQKKLSISQVASKTNKSVLDILDIMGQRNISLNVTLEDLQNGTII